MQKEICFWPIKFHFPTPTSLSVPIIAGWRRPALHPYASQVLYSFTRHRQSAWAWRWPWAWPSWGFLRTEFHYIGYDMANISCKTTWSEFNYSFFMKIIAFSSIVSRKHCQDDYFTEEGDQWKIFGDFFWAARWRSWLQPRFAVTQPYGVGVKLAAVLMRDASLVSLVKKAYWMTS